MLDFYFWQLPPAQWPHQVSGLYMHLQMSMDTSAIPPLWLGLSSEPQTHTSNFLFNISIWIANKFLNLACSEVRPRGVFFPNPAPTPQPAPSQSMATPSLERHGPKFQNHSWFFSHPHILHSDPPANSAGYTFKVHPEPSDCSLPSLRQPIPNPKHLPPGTTRQPPNWSPYVHACPLIVTTWHEEWCY